MDFWVSSLHGYGKIYVLEMHCLDTNETEILSRISWIRPNSFYFITFNIKIYAFNLNCIKDLFN